jgi:hypothetical protein
VFILDFPKGFLTLKPVKGDKRGGLFLLNQAWGGKTWSTKPKNDKEGNETE